MYIVAQVFTLGLYQQLSKLDCSTATKFQYLSPEPEASRVVLARSAKASSDLCSCLIHSYACSEEGQMLICGEGEAGKLGLGSTQSVFLPCLVPLEAWPILVAAGGNHTVAVAGNHQYICEITTSTTNNRLQFRGSNV